MKILIVGRTGTGKDTLRYLLETKGLTSVLSTTDRPKRTEDECTHRFVDTQTVDEEWGKAVAKTTIGKYHYYATKSQVEQHDIYLIDPDGLYELTANMPDTAFMVVYMQADAVDCKTNACKRADDPINEELVFNARAKAENEQFSKFEKTLDDFMHSETKKANLPNNITTVMVFTNDYKSESMESLAASVYQRFTMQKGIYKMLQTLIEKDFVQMTKNHKPQFLDENMRLLSPDIYADVLVNDHDRLGETTLAYLLANRESITSPDDYKCALPKTVSESSTNNNSDAAVKNEDSKDSD